MAVISVTTARISGGNTYTWTTLTASDTGEVITPGGATGAVGCIQMTGTFGGTVSLQASNDGTNWVSVLDLAGAAIDKTAAGLSEFTSTAVYLRVSAGTGVSDVDAILVTRG